MLPEHLGSFQSVGGFGGVGGNRQELEIFSRSLDAVFILFLSKQGNFVEL